MEGLKIVIGQAGWVWVGRVERQGDHIKIHNGRCIRRWGTANKGGLAYLAKYGPTPETVLEDPNNKTLHVLAVIGYEDCDEKVWNL